MSVSQTTVSTNRQRNTSLDLIRGVAIVFVVLGHAIQANIVPGETSFVWEKVILAFQMPLLFLISGFTAGYSFPNKNTSSFIKKKTLRLFVPYLCWAGLHYAIVCVLPNDYRSFSVSSILEEVFISDFWFLRMLFVFFCCTLVV